MSFLTINGFTPSIAEPGQTANLDDVYERLTRMWGTIKIKRLGLVRAWSFSTTLLTKDEADGLEGLINGSGNYFSFQTDLWGSEGVKPVYIGWTAGTASGKVGLCAAASSGQAWDFSLYNYLYNKTRTILVYRNPGTGTWTHYAVRDDGVKFVDGSRNDAASTTFLSWDDRAGTLTISGGTSYKFDELIVVPYRMSLTMIPAFRTYMNAGNRFSALRKLKVTGDFLNGVNTEITCVGFVTSADDQGRPSSDSGGWDNAARRLSFTLVESKRSVP